MSFTQQMIESQSISVFKMILTIHIENLEICESLAKVIAIHSASPEGQEECIKEEILSVLGKAFDRHPKSETLLEAVGIVIHHFIMTEAGKQACIQAGFQNVIDTID